MFDIIYVYVWPLITVNIINIDRVINILLYPTLQTKIQIFTLIYTFFLSFIKIQIQMLIKSNNLTKMSQKLKQNLE